MVDLEDVLAFMTIEDALEDEEKEDQEQDDSSDSDESEEVIF